MRCRGCRDDIFSSNFVSLFISITFFLFFLHSSFFLFLPSSARSFHFQFVFQFVFFLFFGVSSVSLDLPVVCLSRGASPSFPLSIFA